jgi:hypothetical protein
MNVNSFLRPGFSILQNFWSAGNRAYYMCIQYSTKFCNQNKSNNLIKHAWPQILFCIRFRYSYKVLQSMYLISILPTSVHINRCWQSDILAELYRRLSEPSILAEPTRSRKYNHIILVEPELSYTWMANKCRIVTFSRCIYLCNYNCYREAN